MRFPFVCLAARRSRGDGAGASTPGYVKLLLPPRQSRGNSHFGLEFEIRLKNKGCADRNASRRGASMVWDRTQKVLLYRPAQGCALAGPLHFPLDKPCIK